MSVQLNESVGISPAPSGSKWHTKVIESGWGSSGYYSEAMLSEFGPKVFTAGTKVFMNHPSKTEADARPERDVHQLAGKLITDAVFKEGALYADIEFYSHYAPIIREMAGDVGLSIHALGEASVGEAEGRKGPIIESLVADPLTSVDVVTVAGAGGKFMNLLESYTRKDTSTIVGESLTEGNGMSITKEEFSEAIAELKATFVEALSPVVASVSALAEAAKPVVAAEAESDALDPVEVAAKFNESGLPKVALNRVAEALKSEANTKTVEELLAEEKAYADSIIASAPKADATLGAVLTESTTTLIDEFDAIVSRHVGK